MYHGKKKGMMMGGMNKDKKKMGMGHGGEAREKKMMGGAVGSGQPSYGGDISSAMPRATPN